MKKLSLLLLLSVFVFCGCSDDDDTKTYVLSLPNYETHTLDMGNQENPDDSWSVSSDWGTTNYKYTDKYSHGTSHTMMYRINQYITTVKVLPHKCNIHHTFKAIQ